MSIFRDKSFIPKVGAGGSSRAGMQAGIGGLVRVPESTVLQLQVELLPTHSLHLPVLLPPAFRTPFVWMEGGVQVQGELVREGEGGVDKNVTVRGGGGRGGQWKRTPLFL